MPRIKMSHEWYEQRIDVLEAENKALRAEVESSVQEQIELKRERDQACAELEQAKIWTGSMRPHLEAFLGARPAPPRRVEHVNGCAWYVGGPCTRGCAQPAAPEDK